MSTPTPFLDGVLLLAGSYPAGFGHTLFSLGWTNPTSARRAFLSFQVLPYLLIASGMAVVRPDLISFVTPGILGLVAAVAVAPLLLAVEYLLTLMGNQPGEHTETQREEGARSALSSFLRSLSSARPVLPELWQERLSWVEHGLLTLIVIGEEIVYRGIWLGVLRAAGLPAPIALLGSALAYGINHIALGRQVLVAKTVSGCAYGALYLAAGETLWVPCLLHGTQNFLLLFALGRNRRE